MSSIIDESINHEFNFFTYGRSSSAFSNEHAATERVKKNNCKTSKTTDKSSYEHMMEYAAKQLSGYLEMHIKEFEHSAVKRKYCTSEERGIRLFSDSDLLCNSDLILECEEACKTLPKKKKKRTISKAEKELLLDEAAVSADWIFKQSEIHNSL